jgi:hypothetical protein
MTSKQQPTFNIGDKVLRKVDTNFVLIGEVIRREGGRVRVAWPDARRIGGNGLYHTSVKPGSLIPATDEAVKRRKIKWYQNAIANEERLEARFAWYCPSCKRRLDAGWSRNGTSCVYCDGPVTEAERYISQKLPRYRQALQDLVEGK